MKKLAGVEVEKERRYLQRRAGGGERVTGRLDAPQKKRRHDAEKRDGASGREAHNMLKKAKQREREKRTIYEHQQRKDTRAICCRCKIHAQLPESQEGQGQSSKVIRR